MSRTNKDAAYRQTVLELVKRNAGTFDVLLNGKLDRTNIPEMWLPNEICVRFGFCGDEYDRLLREVCETGRTMRSF